ncbi:hypothetical protein [Pararhizobium antarcticum]|uniref:Uncharacterized protein n=1 Tax=Pararhizobium antarcticum TaxID=1798805 RepID=A0A657LU61_9HYPH|nr:hypothetical protein [Pararhizobium antarcticum]OJF91957.1 hypothetical protein AX761_05565 [Rhizobium sp. 58]OJF98340.1 hypothetical protein AX760_14625 [Pararhizobium antarcticum]
MKTASGAFLLVLLAIAPAGAATVTNKDADTAILVVVEGESRMEIAVDAGGSESICPAGCFLTTPSGDRIGLQGDENVEIINGSAVVK